MHYTSSANLRKHRGIFVSFAIACLTVTLLLAVNALSIASHESIVITYPILKSAEPSNTYSVTVNGSPVFVEKYNSLSYIHFAFAGKANIEITLKENVKKYTLSPKRYKLSSSANRNKIYFSLTVPRKLILHQVNLSKENLFIIADSLEDISPKVGDINVTNIMDFGVDNTGKQDSTTNIQKAIDRVSAHLGILYFPPGIYKIKQLNLKSNMTLYLAGGSVLEATKEINPSYGRGLLYIKDVNNVKIMGRGVVYGNGSYWRSHGGWYSLIELENANNIILQDILIKDPCVANVWISHSENVAIYNVKILADPDPEFLNTDGFDFWSSRNITIDNVLYKGTDDATSHGGDKNSKIQNNEQINVKNSVFYGGNGFKIGATVKQDLIRNITYENIDLVLANEMSGFWPITGANFENIYFKNIRIEDILDVPEADKGALIFNWRIKVASWQPDSSAEKLGYIRNIYVSHLTADDRGGNNSVFQGYDSQRDIRNVTFDNLYIEGKEATNPENAFFDFRPSDKDGNNYVNLKFVASNPTIVNLEATDLYASESGDAGEFRITRTGNTSQALTVKYTIRGTAKNGTDYQTIHNAVTIPAGASEAATAILAKQDSNQTGLKTVFLCLENLPNSTDYMLGSDYHAVVNISN
jgi:polygalacturonase